VYAAEIALARNDLRTAYQLYQQVANPPEIVTTRIADIRKRLYDQLVAADSIASLREALQLEPGATAARMLLVQKLLATKSYDEARRELDPILNTGDVDRPDVQESLAEIDVGRGRYQEAIVRYDRLARRTNDPRYTQRLNAIKDQFAAANMPPQVQHALETDVITRADFAVLLYWKVPSIRFAQNVGAPPIAVDLDSDVIGREEMIRAIALGIFPVDSITRRASPNMMLTAIATARAASRALALRGASCTREAGNDPQKVLAACGVNDPTIGTTPDAPVTGRLASTMAEQIDKALR
jgi:tetratricopeptide (TPR) repeat protein